MWNLGIASKSVCHVIRQHSGAKANKTLIDLSEITAEAKSKLEKHKVCPNWQKKTVRKAVLAKFEEELESSLLTEASHEFLVDLAKKGTNFSITDQFGVEQRDKVRAVLNYKQSINAASLQTEVPRLPQHSEVAAQIAYFKTNGTLDLGVLFENKEKVKATLDAASENLPAGTRDDESPVVPEDPSPKRRKVIDDNGPRPFKNVDSSLVGTDFSGAYKNLAISPDHLGEQKGRGPQSLFRNL
jgi:hypothetical protein